MASSTTNAESSPSSPVLLRVQRLYPGARLPEKEDNNMTYALRVPAHYVFAPKEAKEVDMGLVVGVTRPGYLIRIIPKTGSFYKLEVKEQVLSGSDSEELTIHLSNPSRQRRVLLKNTRVARLLVQPYVTPEMIELPWPEMTATLSKKEQNAEYIRHVVERLINNEDTDEDDDVEEVDDGESNGDGV